jgi:hypothetical protein
VQIPFEIIAETAFEFVEMVLPTGGFRSQNSVAGFLVRVFAEQNSRNKFGKSD